MCEDITEKKWAAQVRRVHSQMASYVQPYLASISRTYDNIHAQHHGSGVYLELKSDRYMLTCEHVVRTGYENGNRIAHLPKANSYYHSFPTEWRAVPFPVDLAINHIVPEFWSQSDRQFLPLSRIAETHDVTANELLMLCGYAAQTSQFTLYTGPLLQTPAIPYTARETTLPAAYDAGIHFALQYEMHLSQSADESEGNLPAPPGFSGAPIWDSGFVASKCSDDWTPAHARIVGIVTHWKEDDSCVIATKAEKVREFLLATGSL